MKHFRVLVDITDPTAPFIHRGNRRKGHRYLVFRLERSSKQTYWDTWRAGTLPSQRGYFAVDGYTTRGSFCEI